MQIESMMKAGRSMGGQGAVVHGMDVQGKNPRQIGNGTKAAQAQSEAAHKGESP